MSKDRSPFAFNRSDTERILATLSQPGSSVLRKRTKAEKLAAEKLAKASIRTFYSDALGAVTIPEDER